MAIRTKNIPEDKLICLRISLKRRGMAHVKLEKLSGVSRSSIANLVSRGTAGREVRNIVSPHLTPYERFLIGTLGRDEWMTLHQRFYVDRTAAQRAYVAGEFPTYQIDAEDSKQP